MITERDARAIEFIEQVQVATTTQVNEYVYQNTRVCQRRLSSLVNDKVLTRMQNLYSKEYVYSCKPINPKQLKHKLLRTRFFLELTKLADVRNFIVEETFENIRPDAIVLCTKDKKGFLFALEIETANNKINTLKYEIFIKEHFDKFFTEHGKSIFSVVYVTDKRIPKTTFKTIKINPNLSDIGKVIAF